MAAACFLQEVVVGFAAGAEVAGVAEAGVVAVVWAMAVVVPRISVTEFPGAHAVLR